KSFSRRFCPKRRTRERTVKLRAIKKHGVTINKYYFTLEIQQNEIKRKKECRSVTAVIASYALVEVPVYEGRCSLNSWVFKSFLTVERDAPALVLLGSSFHQRGTTNENSLDCRTCTDGRAKRRWYPRWYRTQEWISTASRPTPWSF